MKNTATLVAVALLALVGGLFYWQVLNNQGQGDQLPDFSLNTLQGESWRASDWQHKTLVINFWATWCPPCREEMPLFVSLQEEFADKGVQFVGIAIDNEAKVAEFANTYQINFPILLGGEEGSALASQLGNQMGGLPYTVIARNGVIAKRHIGGLNEPQLRPMLEQLSSQN